MPANVLRLKNRVPTNWIAALHHEGSDPHLLPRLTVACRRARPAASVKKIEPDEEDDADGARAHKLLEPWKRADEEAHRTDRETSGDPAIPGHHHKATVRPALPTRIA